MIRTRVALVFGAVFLVLGALLLGVVNLLSRAGTQEQAATIATRAITVQPFEEARGTQGPVLAPLAVRQVSEDVSDAAWRQNAVWSSMALLGVAFLAVAVGWYTAGRLLRPVHVMTERAKRLSADNLHERIGASGPDDELKELGDTIDDLLGRLEKAFDSQRRFIANASHELRTPLATQRAAIQIGLDDPTPDDLARTRATLLDNNRRSEALIEGLLMLARSERGLAEREEVDLAEVVREEAARYPCATVTGVRSTCVSGNRALLARLTANLLANATAYHGRVEVAVFEGGLTVSNPGGAEVGAAEVPALFEPFRRGEGRDRMGPGAGLGLSIVRSIAGAHGGTATAVPLREGGLTVTVLLPGPRLRPVVA
ncbi:cell wall metabolism sensor histidine kinase WalK [Streptomyces sp. TLI_146]|uniref:sensor histidine kinase n=1 Tax=Streptomyces sp. TLI_146 TaxID=1938858 RepID=UPI000CB5EAEB|nr:histidine kinase dimerization/phospho-acceptor domain-containing protein [Streptomyces sp. TLI_146]PKV86654.1 signal transduction histidine kinase [Streptomyces sp. TLI_146]